MSLTSSQHIAVTDYKILRCLAVHIPYIIYITLWFILMLSYPNPPMATLNSHLITTISLKLHSNTSIQNIFCFSHWKKKVIPSIEHWARRCPLDLLHVYTNDPTLDRLCSSLWLYKCESYRQQASFYEYMSYKLSLSMSLIIIQAPNQPQFYWNTRNFTWKIILTCVKFHGRWIGTHKEH